VLEMIPKDDEPTHVFGDEKNGVLVTLNASNRNCTLRWSYALK
jgi:hypothetical protein